jgi:hypothetical protein
MQIERAEAFRTKDMTEATLLASQGFRYKLELHSTNLAVWVFEVTDENAEDLYAISHDYTERSARVEPRAFMKEVGRIRSELYKFLKTSPVRVSAEHSASPSASPS